MIVEIWQKPNIIMNIELLVLNISLYFSFQIVYGQNFIGKEHPTLV